MKRDYRLCAAAAQFVHYPHPEREQRWLARLGFNQGEISSRCGAFRGGKPIGLQLMTARGRTTNCAPSRRASKRCLAPGRTGR
jgi:hypothetical protein